MNTLLKNLLVTCIILVVMPKVTQAQFFFIIGCKSPTACNYDPQALIHDESLCEYPNFLCTDPCDESTCLFVPEIPEIFIIPELEPDLCPWCPVCLTCPPFELEQVVNPAINPEIEPNFNPWIGGPKLGNPESDSDNSFTIFPNPTNGKVTITLDYDSTAPHSITVFNLSGKTIQQYTFKGYQTNADLSEIAKGMYLIKIQNDQTKDILSTQKLLIK